MKKFWKYFLITLLLLIGLLCVGILYLFFVPNSNLFGIMYISLNENFYSSGYNLTDGTTVFVNSRSYPVRFVTSANEYMSVRVYSNSLGFVHESHSTVEISAELSSSSINITISEPYGACIVNDSFIEIRLPEDSNLNFSLKNKNADTTFNSSTLSVNDLSYSTTSGDFDMLSGNIKGSLDLELNKADFTLGKDVVMNNNRVTLSVTSGKFDSTSNAIDELIIEKNSNGVILLGNCNNLLFDSNLAGGRIEAKTINLIDVQSSDTNIYIDTLLGGSIQLTKSGKISINKAYGNPTLITANGSINVKEMFSNASLVTTNGKITVDLAYSNISTESDYGDIVITFISGDNDTTINFLDAKTNNGKIEAKNVDRTFVDITNRGRANIYFNTVNGASTINGQNGDIYVQFDSNNTLTLTTSSNSGNVDVYYAGLPAGEPHTAKELTSFNIQTNSTSTNKINISTNSGALRVRDNIMADLGR